MESLSTSTPDIQATRPSILARAGQGIRGAVERVCSHINSGITTIGFAGALAAIGCGPGIVEVEGSKDAGSSTTGKDEIQATDTDLTATGPQEGDGSSSEEGSTGNDFLCDLVKPDEETQPCSSCIAQVDATVEVAHHDGTLYEMTCCEGLEDCMKDGTVGGCRQTQDCVDQGHGGQFGCNLNGDNVPELAMKACASKLDPNGDCAKACKGLTE